MVLAVRAEPIIMPPSYLIASHRTSPPPPPAGWDGDDGGVGVDDVVPPHQSAGIVIQWHVSYVLM